MYHSQNSYDHCVQENRIDISRADFGHIWNVIAFVVADLNPQSARLVFP